MNKKASLLLSLIFTFPLMLQATSETKPYDPFSKESQLRVYFNMDVQSNFLFYKKNFGTSFMPTTVYQGAVGMGLEYNHYGIELNYSSSTQESREKSFFENQEVLTVPVISFEEVHKGSISFENITLDIYKNWPIHRDWLIKTGIGINYTHADADHMLLKLKMLEGDPFTDNKRFENLIGSDSVIPRFILGAQYNVTENIGIRAQGIYEASMFMKTLKDNVADDTLYQAKIDHRLIFSMGFVIYF